MKICLVGEGPLAEQAGRLLDALGAEREPDREQADWILPATEDDALLKTLAGPKTLLDEEAWALCSSRLKTDAYLREHSLPVPAVFPGGSEPYLVKPDRGSFGLGIWVTDDYCEVGGAVNAGFLTQEELPGDVWSIVVTGVPGAYTVHPAMRLSFNDLRRRTGAVPDEAPEAGALRETARKAAECVGVHGVLEVEAMLHNGVWEITDLNARLPMYTSDALLEKGVNLLGELIEARRAKA